MPFDLSHEEVETLRSKYEGVHADAEEVLRTAEEIQEHYLPKSAAIGNLTTIEGAQSTKTRRPLSASVDLVVEDNSRLEDLGRDYDSWEHMGAYFADINGLEVGIIHSGEFSLWDFPDETFDNSYKAKVKDYNVVLAEPASNVSSKVNRMLGGEVVKNSDAVDLASHLHWSRKTGRNSVKDLANRVSDTVSGPYEEVIEEVRDVRDSFNKTEREGLEDALTEFEGILTN